MDKKVTKLKVKYHLGYEPDFTVPVSYKDYRFVLGKHGKKPLICIGMNPSAAREEYSDRTVNKVIKNAINNGYDGWIMLNIYPERATEAKNLNPYSEELHKSNIENIISIIKKYDATEVWGAWGDIDTKQKYLSQVKQDIIQTLKKNNIKVFHFQELSKIGNPKHPLYIKIDFNNKNYLE